MKVQASSDISLSKLPPVNEKTNPDMSRLRELSQEFEALFLNQVIQSMRSTIPEGAEDSMFKKSEGEKVFQSMLDDEYSKTMSAKSLTGIGEAIFQKLSQVHQQTQKHDGKQAYK